MDKTLTIEGRTFRLTLRTYRAGAKYERRTAREWIVTERGPGDMLIASLRWRSGRRCSTLAVARDLCTAHVADDGKVTVE